MAARRSGMVEAVRARVARAVGRRGGSPFRDLRRVEPVSRVFGLDRGLPVDRWFIEVFLERHADDIRGPVLEVGDDRYTRRFGRPDSSDVLNLHADSEGTTLALDLTRPAEVPRERFGCIICTQTLQFVHDVPAAVRSLHSMLQPGGVVLCTVGGISQISRYDMDRWGDHWRFTTLSARTVFEQVFGAGAVEVEAFGNVLVAVAFLEGLAAEELRPEELAFRDDDYQVLITVRATKTRAPG
jgi:hypothetical protein